MKAQQVSVDYWSMGSAMLMYGAMTALCWLMLRLFHVVFTLPGRLRSQQNTVQNNLKELQRRYPNLNITEEDLKNAEEELEKITKENDKENSQEEEDKKTI